LKDQVTITVFKHSTYLVDEWIRAEFENYLGTKELLDKLTILVSLLYIEGSEVNSIENMDPKAPGNKFFYTLKR
jgi:hypothetical protein